MTTRAWVRAAVCLAILPAGFAVGSPAFARTGSPGDFTAEVVHLTSRVSAMKTPTSRLAQTDPSLLGRDDGTPVSVLVKLDHDSVATYAGGVAGYAPTSPQRTGRPLSNSAAERRYAGYLAERENAFVSRLSAKVPSAETGLRLRTVYGGLAVVVPANRVRDLLAVAGVVAVQADTLRQPLTDASPGFIGATSLYPQLGGKADAGKGVIFGVLDTGAWPEHPSFADHGNLGAPPPKADGTPRTCNFGDNPLTPANDVFVCNRKLIGGRPFLDTYNAQVGGEMYTSARDSNGHGTHTGSTAAGDPVGSAPVLGVDRGPVQGIAPGAWVSVYKVCGASGCFASDATAAVQQAVKDGVNVINYSISGGTTPLTDPVELAFLDAYAAGVFVAASAGNSGPGAGTANHLSPWVTTVAASTQRREFASTLTLTAGADTATFTGASLTGGAGPLPVVLASAAPYSHPLCDVAAPPGVFTGKIVACQRGGNGRVEKGFNVLQGGAAGMVLYNPTLADVETDNHWLPTVHLADGGPFLAFMGGHSGVTAQFTAGAKRQGTADVMAAFSSRGPAGNFIKPDITAPGVQILAGTTPTPEDVAGGPPGQYYQAIAGTSMSSPHIAGSAVLLKALHPTWTPGQLKSAIMTTATEQVVKEDGTTPADPFDLGAGRVSLGPAANPGLTFDETAANMAALTADSVHAVHLNLPSVNAPVMPGRLTTIRTAVNVTNRTQTYVVRTSAPAQSSITVSPSVFAVRAGQSVRLSIRIASNAPTGQYFGVVRLDPVASGLPTLHLPVAFVPQQGAVSLTSSCSPATIARSRTSDCTVTATNNSNTATTVDLATNTSINLPVTGVTGATRTGLFSVAKQGVTLAGAQPGVPSIAPGPTPAGYLPLGLFGITPIPIGDEEFLNFNVPGFRYSGGGYSRIGVNSNGYVVLGGGEAADVNCCNLTQIPDPARPNNVLAPYWTDLDGSGAPGISIATLTDGGVHTWLVVQWDVNVFGTNQAKTFQIWIGLDWFQDISFTYDPAQLPGLPGGQPLLVGAENRTGTGGAQLPAGTPPTQDLVVTSTDPTPGGTTSYTLTVRGVLRGTGSVTTSMDSPLVPGTTVVTSRVTVN
jgi:subtilisin family serine protease